MNRMDKLVLRLIGKCPWISAAETLLWVEDRERRREAGVPEEVVFQTKGQLARRMLERAV